MDASLTQEWKHLLGLPASPQEEAQAFKEALDSMRVVPIPDVDEMSDEEKENLYVGDIDVPDTPKTTPSLDEQKAQLRAAEAGDLIRAQFDCESPECVSASLTYVEQVDPETHVVTARGTDSTEQFTLSAAGVPIFTLTTSLGQKHIHPAERINTVTMEHTSDE